MSDQAQLDAWSVIKTGMYRASSDRWTVSCVARTRQESIAKLRAQTGETWARLRAGGFEVVKIKLLLEPPAHD